MMADEKQCSKVFCFVQVQFVSLILFVALLLAGGLCLYVMHHFKDDGDIVWAQGIFSSVMAAFLVSLKTNPSAQHQGDTIKTGDNTVVNAPAPALPVEQRPE